MRLRKRPGGWHSSWPKARMATWTGWQTTRRSGAAIRARCGRRCAPSSCSASTMTATTIRWPFSTGANAAPSRSTPAATDYHDIIKPRLKRWRAGSIAQAGGDVKVFVDTAAVMEKPLAGAAGLGWQGKHTNLVSRQFGSWLFLGAIFTTLDLPPRCGG